jgi:putative ABC transport system permease protein
MRYSRRFGAVIALALLVCGCVFAAAAGPAESLRSQTQALRQTLAGLGEPAKTVEITTPLRPFLADVLYGSDFYSGKLPPLTVGLLDEAKTQMHNGLAGVPLPLAAGDWAGLTAKPVPVYGGYAPRAYSETQPQLEILYRDTLTSNLTVTAGRLAPTGPVPPGALAVSVTGPTAARFGLRPGSRMKALGLTLVVTGIVRAQGLGSSFWQADPLSNTPMLEVPGKGASYWEGVAFADPDQLGAVQALLGYVTTAVWEFPLALNAVTADQAQTLDNHLSGVVQAPPRLTGRLAGGANDIALSTGLVQPLGLFLQTQTSVLAVLLLLFVSLIAIGVAVIVLAARMLVERREDDLVMLRARGASSRQVAALLARDAAPAVLPGAAAGVALAAVLVPGSVTDSTGSAVLGWGLAAVALVVALAGPALIGAWRHRRPAPAANPARVTSADTGVRLVSARGLIRLVAELTACGIAIAGLIVLHNQGVPAAGGTNWYLTVAPVLAAVPAVLIVLRLYPLVIRLLLWLARHRAGATGYIALAASARTSLATAGPAFALVLALTLSAFSGMVSDAISNGQVAASWQATGADAVINTSQVAVPVTPAIQHAIAGVPGVQRESAVWNMNWSAPAVSSLAVTGVDPAQYAALSAGTPFPRIPAGLLRPSPRPVTQSTVIDVLASPAAAAALGHGTVQLTSVLRVGPIQVHIVGTIAATPAYPAGGMFLLMPLEALPGFAGTPVPNVVLADGAGIDHARLAAAAARLLPGSDIAFRSDVLDGLHDSPLQRGALLLLLLTTIAAAAFGLLNLVLGLAVGAPARDLTFARLNVMGHAHGGRLAMTEALPAVVAAAIAGLACALVLPPLVGNAIDLSVFTDTTQPAALKPDFVSVGLPAAAMVVLAVVVLAAQTRFARHRGATSLLRAH